MLDIFLALGIFWLFASIWMNLATKSKDGYGEFRSCDISHAIRLERRGK